MASASSPTASSQTAPQSSVSPTTTVVSPISKTNPLFTSFNQANSIKLDRGNYLLWESIILPIIEGNKLEHHLNCHTEPPPKLIPDVAGMTVNTAFEDWHATNRLLVGWLRNTMSVEVGTHLLHCQSASALWAEARSLASASTKAQIMIYKFDLHRTRKGGMKMEEFLTKMKNIADHLTLAGATVSFDELIIHTLNGLNHEYNAIVVKLIDQTHLSWVEIQAHLLALESRLEQLSQFANLSVEPSVNIAHRGGFSHHRSGSSFHRSSPVTDSDSSYGNWRSGRGSRGNPRGRGGRSACKSGTRGRFCNYCKKPGRDISRYFYLNDDDGHLNFASAGSVADPTWYMDSGANHHVAPSTDYLDQTSASGKSFISTCTGERTPILATGNSKLAPNLNLNKILVVPSSTKKLMSVSQLVHDNAVTIEFNHLGCYVKDWTTGQLVMHDRTNQSLYPVISNAVIKNDEPRQSFPAAEANFAIVNSDFAVWHRKLGHPGKNVVRHILNKCNVRATHSEYDFCDACQYGKSKY
ncbi:hypothetical protein QN277_014565 [Acacia crassicarpa]|uniref:GAG-pre-integrase domain-containing protein n=1 Tax=Acacia crassicarpa TaxID=499986 RepID=A0AAE1IML0_9FABA|nr:hypothetical protein QN277_014565 [Acacia crassicarpa]